MLASVPIAPDGRGRPGVRVEQSPGVGLLPSASTKASARLRPDQREAAERAHAAHQQHCPGARSLRRPVEIAIEPHLEDEG